MEMNIAVAVIATAMFALVAESALASDDLTGDCRIGTYHLEDGTDVDIAATEGPHLRWRRRDGTTGELTKESDGSWTSTVGWTKRPAARRVSFSDCARGEISFDGVKGKRIAFDVTETKFQGAGVTLGGRLVMPKGSSRVPIVVLIHGSEHDSARDFNALQRQFPAEGIGAFVYDKRGTGASTGRYTHDYLLLAEDAIAAVHEAKRLGGSRAGRIGYQAPSQGGWVAPLAAKIEPVDFVIVGFGLAVSPLDEDREAIALDVTRHGYGADVMDKAMEVADATAAIVLSDFREGYDRLDAVRTRYGKEPWFKYIHGDITFALLQMSQDQLRKRGPELLPHLPAQYDPMPVLRNLDVPQLWILAADDTDAPSAETVHRLRALAAEGKPIVTAVFPRTDHGIYEYETKADGTRMSTRHPDGYFAMMLDFIRTGRVGKSYGTSVIFHSSRDQE
jgi:pimeloyl-ACP methyl ester carboxylesterase